MGFEPTIRHYPYNGLANRRLQPLGHPSTDEWVHGVCKASVSGWRGQPRLTRRTRHKPAIGTGSFFLTPRAASIACAAASSGCGREPTRINPERRGWFACPRRRDAITPFGLCQPPEVDRPCSARPSGFYSFGSVSSRASAFPRESVPGPASTGRLHGFTEGSCAVDSDAGIRDHERRFDPTRTILAARQRWTGHLKNAFRRRKTIARCSISCGRRVPVPAIRLRQLGCA